MAGGIFLVATAAMVLWLRAGRFASTDNAYVHAAKLMVSTDVSGIVSSVDVREGQAVKTGDILFRIDPRQYEIALNNARASLEQTALSIEFHEAGLQAHDKRGCGASCQGRTR